MTTLTKSTGTVTLSGAVEKVTFPAVYGWVWFWNKSDSDMYAGLSENISEGADGVAAIPAGGCRRIQTDGFKSVYLLGTGNVEISAQNYSDCPFKVGGKGGEIPDLSAYALKSKYGDTTIDVGRKEGTVVGIRSTAEGQDTTASEACSHAEGSNTKASGVCSHAEGVGTIASNAYSHAEGDGTTASGVRSHAGGGSSVASGDSSFAHGKNVQALHDHEVAFGKYNKSSSDTLFSVGDGTSDTARHNAFEITVTGGYLHNKNIATTDLIPTELPANGGNADTVDGLHADDFVNATDKGQIQIPNNVDVPSWIYANGKRFQRYMTNGDNIGLINVPNNSIVHVWYWYDGLNILARENSSGKYYICDMINGVFSGWKDVYTSGYKPYVTGTLSEQANDSPVTLGFTIFDFTPSKVICQCGNGNAFFANVIPNGFSLTIPAGTTTIHYIAFK